MERRMQTEEMMEEVGGGERLHAVGGKQVQSVSVLFSEGVSGEINKANRPASYLPKEVQKHNNKHIHKDRGGVERG